ncbi:hypothetical protein RvY_00720 [Ramazzottius varieornatus]|uniref:Uncharacterized protein n=1 Tax=Ramazzottius varieornatus TaxID=947166 RepID=A0A1D1UKY8_RAMVA|nr:hypothetical protein RvY_00720 [Ramazzottius varieornatus]
MTVNLTDESVKLKERSLIHCLVVSSPCYGCANFPLPFWCLISDCNLYVSISEVSLDRFHLPMLLVLYFYVLLSSDDRGSRRLDCRG